MHDSKYDWGKDWRGTALEPGCIVVYHAQTKGGKTVEAEVVSITDGDDYCGKTVMVRPLKESGIAVARPPYFYEREDKKLFAVSQLKVTVIKAAPNFSGFGGEVNKELIKTIVAERKERQQSFVEELVEAQMIRRNERDDPRCLHCGDYALYDFNGPRTSCGPNGCYNTPA